METNRKLIEEQKQIEELLYWLSPEYKLWGDGVFRKVEEISYGELDVFFTAIDIINLFNEENPQYKITEISRAENILYWFGKNNFELFDDGFFRQPDSGQTYDASDIIELYILNS